jgi:hypothetical protein
MSVMVDNLIQPIDSWIKNITVHCKAVSSSLTEWRHSTTEAVKIDKLVTVVVLQNATH